MNESPLNSTPSHARYMDFIAPKKKPIPSGRPTREVAKKPVEKPVEKPAPKVVKTPVKAPEAPDASKYTLGGKSPFLKSVTVEKRPLSDSVAKKNVYPEKPVEKVEEKKEPTKIIKKKEKRGGGFGLFLIIILTIILGAAVGVAAYFMLPK